MKRVTVTVQATQKQNYTVPFMLKFFSFLFFIFVFSCFILPQTQRIFFVNDWLIIIFDFRLVGQTNSKNEQIDDWIMLKNSSQSTMYIEVFQFSLLVIVARIIKNVVAVYFRTQSIKSEIQFSPSCFIVCSLLLCFCLKSDVFVSLLYSSREKGKEETNKTQNRNARTTQRNRLVYLYALV